MSQVEYGHAIHEYANAIDKYKKIQAYKYKPSHLNYWDVNNFYRRLMSQKLPAGGFKWIENTSQFNFKLMFNILKKLHNLHNGLSFLPEKTKIGKV